MAAQPEHDKETTGASPACGSCTKTDCSATQRRSGESDQDFKDRQLLESRLCRIKHKVVVLSGKGGVGKSTIAVNLAVALMLEGRKVGLLDADIHGPSVPTMLGLEGEHPQGGPDGLVPPEVGGLKVMSIGFFLNSPDDAIIWRGPLKMGVLKQFLKDVTWGELDYLIVDSPPGTGDEPLSIVQLIGKVDGAVIVTTPQRVAAIDVRKSVNFCRQLKVPVLGVVENMSGFACPKCGDVTQVFRTGAGQQIAKDMLVPFLGAIPLDPQVAEASDSGRAFVHQYGSTPTAKAMLAVVNPVLALEKNDQTERKEK
ncbi:Mrp/NBP35 family ATP-binding protein [candidate division WOR-3 bacterium]|nr:Mrp/NBP35 family ATP-binding protein [candidate division WOR-3 bacterium]